MAELVQRVPFALNYNFYILVFLTDSTALLCWLKVILNKLFTLVGVMLVLIPNPATSSFWIRDLDWLLFDPETRSPVSKFDLLDALETNRSPNLT